MTEDPVAAARQPILAALRSAAAPAGGSAASAPEARASVVHLVHGWPPENFAGTEMYAWWLAHQQKASRPVAVYTRSADRQFASGTAIELDDRGIRVRARVNHFDQRDPLRRNGLYDRGARADFARFLDQTAPDLLHIHHLAGNGFALVDEARRRRLPIVLQLQDWWLLCARANLLDRDRRLCPGPTPGRCGTCLPLTRMTPSAGLNGLLNRALYRIRSRRARGVLAAADVLIAGSSAILDSFRALGFLPARVPIHLVPYGVEQAPRAIAPSPRAPALPLRLGFIGSLLPHKGLHVATRALAGLPASAVELEVWGDATHDPAYVREAVAAAEGAAVHLRGRFAEEERGAIYAGLDLLLVPSLGLESYSLAAREALAAGLPVVASRRGALAELFDAVGEPCGGQFDPDRPEELRAWIERLIADPRQIADWRRHAPAGADPRRALRGARADLRPGPGRPAHRARLRRMPGLLPARLALAARLLAAEGPRSLVERWRDRRRDEARSRRFTLADAATPLPAGARSPTLWFLPFPMQRRRGGAAIQLLVRLDGARGSRAGRRPPTAGGPLPLRALGAGSRAPAGPGVAEHGFFSRLQR